MLTADEKPIVALATPQGSGAIALIRISGIDTIPLIDKIARLSSNKKLINLKTHTIHHGHIIDGSNIIDEVLFFLMKAPKTFTGQDTIEISCHNNSFIIEQIIALAIKHGASPAQRGEFTKRAFLQNKIDLLQAEAINELINAQTEQALKQSIAQLKGSLSHHIKKIEELLLTLLTYVEASFEFLDEEQHDINLDLLIKTKFKDLKHILEKTCDAFSHQNQIKQGIQIAILGSPNVGKSTLFNALIKKERAIVTNIAGTTRDVIEKNIYKKGIFWTFLDTAGLRETTDIIEKEGINQSWQQAQQSDIILFVLDATKKPSPEEQKLFNSVKKTYANKMITVLNKVDLQKKQIIPESYQPTTTISAKKNIGIKKLEETLEEKIKNILESTNSPFILNQRQQQLISELNIKTKQLAKKNTNRIHYEEMAYHVKEMLETLAQITGKEVHEKMLDHVFNNFCIGK